MKLSVVIPLHNEEECVQKVVNAIILQLKQSSIENEIILVNDSSTDSTHEKIEQLANEHKNIKVVNNSLPSGFGRAIRKGLENITGDIVTIVMGDGSDDPINIVQYYRKIEEGYDCVFGSRFLKQSVIENYPRFKMVFNRMGNKLIQVLFGLKNNDITNAFKAYRAEVINAVMPLESNSFNITVELPLKAIIKHYRYATIPINWYDRKGGVSKYRVMKVVNEYLALIFRLWKQYLTESMKRTAKS